jgi:hypothetical protein
MRCLEGKRVVRLPTARGLRLYHIVTEENPRALGAVVGPTGTERWRACHDASCSHALVLRVVIWRKAHIDSKTRLDGLAINVWYLTLTFSNVRNSGPKHHGERSFCPLQGALPRVHGPSEYDNPSQGFRMA